MPGRGGSGNGVAGFFNAATFFGGGAAFFAAGFFLGAALLRVVIHALRRGRGARRNPCTALWVEPEKPAKCLFILENSAFCRRPERSPDTGSGSAVFHYK